MTRLTSNIYDQGPSPAPQGAEADERNHAAFQNAWKKNGLVVIYPHQIADDWERQTIINVANRQYGKRK